MAARFCSQCGTRVVAGAKFCSECGASLTGGMPVRPTGWRFTAAGSTVLGSLVIAGLTIWTAILTPEPPRAGPAGAPAGPPTPPAAASSMELPPDHPKVPVALPTEAKQFIEQLAVKAKNDPEDVATWAKLGQVYYRAGQLDPAYYPEALTAFQHVLEREPKNADALRGVANVHYDREEHRDAIAAFEKYLAVRPDDNAARTDLGTMRLYNGDQAGAVAVYRDVIKRDPSFMQAHFNLAVAHAQQGNRAAALGELRQARDLSTDAGVRKQIDDMIGRLNGGAPGEVAAGGPESDTGPARSAFQAAVERAFRAHPIMGPRIARFEWPGAGTGRVLVENFPMAGMPDEVRDKFLGRLADEMRKAQNDNAVEGPVRMEIADASSGALMATVTPR